jgi:hypothetical protein
MSENHSSGTTPLKTDTIRTLEVKILNALNSGGGGGGGGGAGSTYNNYAGVAPVTTPATGSLAIDSSTGNGWVYSGSSWIRLF